MQCPQKPKCEPPKKRTETAPLFLLSQPPYVPVPKVVFGSSHVANGAPKPMPAQGDGGQSNLFEWHVFKAGGGGGNSRMDNTFGTETPLWCVFIIGVLGTRCVCDGWTHFICTFVPRLHDVGVSRTDGLHHFGQRCACVCVHTHQHSKQLHKHRFKQPCQPCVHISTGVCAAVFISPKQTTPLPGFVLLFGSQKYCASQNLKPNKVFASISIQNRIKTARTGYVR